MKKPTVTVILDKRRKKDNDRLPVKIRVAMTRDDNRSYSTGIDLTEDEFEKSFERNLKYMFLVEKRAQFFNRNPPPNLSILILIEYIYSLH